MKTKILFVLILLITGTLAFAQKSVPTCNGFDATGTIPMYFAAGSAAGTTLCTDYFGKSNYANSPLPSGPVDVSTTGFTIVNGGSGYLNGGTGIIPSTVGAAAGSPGVTISDAFGTPASPASCSATVTLGVVTGITCASAGNGYIAPEVMITDATGTNAFVLAKIAAAGPLTGGIRKFVDPLPDLKSAIAAPDVNMFPGSDYYEIALVQTTWTMHTDLPASTLRAYVQVPSGTVACPATPPFQYLGPVILAQKNRPVRVKFMNCLPTGAGGDLFIPVDTTYMGAGLGPDGLTPYLQNRATLHLHGGNTPWISDGTPHQWTIPIGETSTYARGLSTQFVPDMYFVGGQIVPQCSAIVTNNCSGGTVAQLPPGASNDPGVGSMSFYWTNQQGGRLMFYHDHAYGITRLNVYVGEAAGYLLADPVEEDALQKVTVPGTLGAAVGGTTPPDLKHVIPLVIQDKTFVPSAGQLASQDPTWIWGTGAASGVNGNGDLWFPHVYTPNQNPADPGGANAYGRWDYGAWFFPPQTSLTAANPPTAVTIPCTSAAFPNTILAPLPANNNLEGCPITPNPSGTPEGFMDTPLVNGKAYPILHVAPEAYRFKILAAGNDRSWNLQLYVADPTGYVNPTTNLPTEVKMLPAVPPATGTLLPLCGTVNQLTQPTLGIGLPSAILDAAGNPVNGTGLLNTCWPNYGSPSPGIPSKQFMWPADGRDGGVPDPRTAGPAFIQIGTEGGLLPSPVVIPSTPANYEANTRSITITNVSAHGLWLGPAERADVIVDFSKFNGQTLILYNDAPTPAPAFDMRDDYYTGDMDQSSTGGAPPTLPGYGPNTRTVMQIVVDQPATVGATPFSLATLKSALPAVFAATQPAPIVPEPTYPAASGGNAPTATYARISDNTITYPPAGLPVTNIAVTAGGANYSAATTVSIAAPGCAAPCATATATPTIVGGVITAITLTSAGSGYKTVPAVTINDSVGTGASATASLDTTYFFDQKAIQELFTLDYGRMNATLGTELPLTNFLVQTTLPFGYAEWATEILQDGQTQIWKLTHNGVDTHFIHFHLFNVQVLNRIGWDGTVRPPDQNELGWKDTVRMNPLEDIVVALTPLKQNLPFPLPDSKRPLDVTLPTGVVSPAISGIDPATGNAIAGGAGTINKEVNFGYEYVWHCHILGHEENDMMRPIIFQVAPPAPSNLAATANSAGGINVTWTDNSANESGFTLERDVDPAFPNPVTLFTNANASVPNTAYGGTIQYIDSTVSTAGTVYYRVQSVDDFSPFSPLSAPFQTVTKTSAWVGPVPFTTNPIAGVAPTALNFGNVLVGTVSGPLSVTLSNTGTSPLTIISIGLTGANLGDFALPVSAVPCGASLAAGASCTIDVTFTPSAVGPRAAFVTIVSNDPVNGTLNVALNGTGIANTAIAIAAPAITYGQNGVVTVTVTSPQVTPVTGNVTLSVDGGTALSQTLVAGSATFNSANTPALVAPTAPSHSLTVTYAAQGGFGASTANGTLTVNPQPLTIAATPNPATMIFGGAVPTITPTYTGFVLAQGPANLTGTVACSTNATSASLVSGNPYSSSCLGASSTNYAITYVPGVMTISKASSVPTITSNLPSPSIVGQVVTVSFRVAPQFTGTPTGSVTVTASTGESCNATLTGAAGSCTLTFRSAGARTLTASYGGDANFLASASAPANQMVSGLTLSTLSLLFGNQVVGTASATQAVTLSNVGTTTITFTSITWSTNFSDTNNCGTSLLPGRSCRINVRFVPTTTGVLNGTLTIVDSDPTNPQIVSLTGTGVAPMLQVTPGALTFNSPMNVTSASQPVTVSNTGTASLTINANSIYMSGANAGQFAETNNCVGTLAPGANCTINVTFRPTFGAAAKTAILNVTGAAPATPQTVSLTGNVIVPTYTLTPNPLPFGNQTVGTRSASQPITLKNTSTAALTVNSIGLGGSTQFAQTNNCVGTVAAGSSCTINVTFAPTSRGAKTATLTVFVAVPATAQSVTLTGTGQ